MGGGGFKLWQDAWGCCNCGDAGKTLFIEACPICGHIRCTNCHFETVALRRGVEPLSRDSDEWVFVTQPANESTLPSRSQIIGNDVDSKSQTGIPTFQSDLDRIFAYYADWKQHTTGERKSPLPTDEVQTQNNGGVYPQTSSSNRRRTVAEREVTQSSNDGNFVLASKRAQPAGPQRLLACPFWKRDPCRHSECSKFKLSKTAHVKQHLKRRHRARNQLSMQCARCGQTFRQAPGLDQHLQQSTPCETGNFVLAELSEYQNNQLSKLSDRRLSVEDQWYRIWDVIYPGIARPTSPYLELELSEDLIGFHHFMTHHGADLFLDERPTNTSFENGQLRSFLQAGIQRIIDSYMLGRHRHISDDSIDPRLLTLPTNMVNSDEGSQPQDESTVSNTSLTSSEEMEWEPIDWFCNLDNIEVVEGQGEHAEGEGEGEGEGEDDEPELSFEGFWQSN